MTLSKASGPLTKNAILLPVSALFTWGAVAQTVNRLKRSGLVRRTNGEGPGTPGAYVITAKGRSVLARLQQ